MFFLASGHCPYLTPSVLVESRSGPNSREQAATWELDNRYPLMDHKGVRYEVLQTVHPAGWKWVAHISHTKQTTGISSSRDLAVDAAKRAIDKALAAREKRDGEPA